MADLHARGITNLNDYIQGRKDERDHIVSLINNDKTLETQLRFIEGEPWIDSVKVILMAFLLLNPEEYN
jgi:hypothetical protein